MKELVRQSNISFTPGTRTITISNKPSFTEENIRVIVNETQKVIVCISLRKDMISINGADITYSGTIPVLQADDKLTIEMDFDTI